MLSLKLIVYQLMPALQLTSAILNFLTLTIDSPLISQAVAGQPRLFVGQIPTTKHEQDLLPLFAKYGDVETLQIVKGPDQKSRGCAMVQFKKWSAAEAALEGLHGTSLLEGSKSRPLVVNFANPRRGSIMSAPGETAIAPRKLSVDGITPDCTEEQLLDLFSIHGEVESITLESESSFACVQYKKWAGCENAIEALHDQHMMPGCDSPLHIKFVEVALTIPRKTNDSSPSPAYTILSSPNVPQGSSDSTQSHAYNYHNHGGGGYGSNNNNSYGGGYNNKRNNNNGVHYMQGGPQQQYHPHAGMVQYIGHPADLAHHMMAQHGQQQAYLHHHHATAAMGIPLAGLPGVPGLLHNPNSLPRNGGRRNGGGEKATATSSSVGGQSSRRGGMGSSLTNGSSDSLGNTSDGSDIGHYSSAAAAANNNNGNNGGMPPFPHHHHHQMISLHEMNNAMHHQYMHAMPAAAYMGYPMMHQAGPIVGPSKKIGRGVVDPTVYTHKLFVGQVPFEATEQDLWHMFAPFGDILELAVLRSGGMSKGCAFLTYATKQQALHATSALHGQHVGASKRLVVKFADHKVNSTSTEEKIEQ